MYQLGSSLVKNKSTILVSNVDNVGSYAHVGAGYIWEHSIPPSQLYYKPNTALKKKKVLKPFKRAYAERL